MIGPILGLVVLDRAVTLSSAHWAWAAREVPRGLLDPYRVEAVLRSIAPGRRNVFVLGDSVIDSALDTERLNEALKDTGRRYTVLRIGGAPTATFGFLANQVASLDPSDIILEVSGYTLRSSEFTSQIYDYDVRVVRDMFTWREILAEPGFHLAGLAGQANVFFRLRHSLQRALAVRLGLTTWARVRMEQLRLQIELSRGEGPLRRWIHHREGDTYPNPNTRAIGVLARKARARGIALIVLETPYHPHLRMLVGESRFRALRAELSRLAREEGFTYVRSEDMVDLGLDDFEDHTHLNETGRRIFTDAAIEKFPGIVR